MNLYISDIHFGHKNVIMFDKRPFADVEEMDKTIIKLWNHRVNPEDDVYIVGDFCYKSANSPEWYMKQLAGHKHLIKGNHDGVILESPEAMKYFESIDKLTHVSDGDKQIVLCHYPMAEWYKSHHGSWHIYGHIHGNKTDTFEFMKTREHAVNAAACINRYTPASMDELIMNNNIFKEDAEKEKEFFLQDENKKAEMLRNINQKVGFDVLDKEAWKAFVLSDEETHERDNVPSPLEELTLEELMFLRYYERTSE